MDFVQCIALHFTEIVLSLRPRMALVLHCMGIGWVGGALHFIALALHCIALQFISVKLSGVLWARNEDGTGGTPAQYEH